MSIISSIDLTIDKWTIKSLKLEELIEKFKKVHKNKYNYSKVRYINCSTKIMIICPIHGEFLQNPTLHSQGHGCSKCGKVYRPTIEEVIEKFKKIHKNKYDYSKVKYKNCDTKVIIICPAHGEFKQTPYGHSKGHGCRECAKISFIKIMLKRKIQRRKK